LNTSRLDTIFYAPVARAVPFRHELNPITLLSATNFQQLSSLWLSHSLLTSSSCLLFPTVTAGPFASSRSSIHHGPYQADRSQVHRGEGPPQAARHEGRSQERPDRRGRQEAPPLPPGYGRPPGNSKVPGSFKIVAVAFSLSLVHCKYIMS